MCCTNDISSGGFTPSDLQGFHVSIAAITIMTRHTVTGLHPVSSQSELTNTHSVDCALYYSKEVWVGKCFTLCQTTYFMHICTKRVTQSQIPLAKLMFMSIFNGLPQTQAF